MARNVEELLQTLRTSSPLSLDGSTATLVQQIVSDGVAEWVSVTPSPTAVMHECFYNVRSHIEKHGGALIYGWAVWEWPDVFVEAEHHAVWELDGKLIDVTPHEAGIERVAFLRDPSATFDWSHSSSRENVRMPISKSEAVQEYLDTARAQRAWMAENSNGREMTLDPRQAAAFFHKSRSLKLEIFAELAAKCGRNQPCICGSGEKFKKCCAQIFA